MFHPDRLQNVRILMAPEMVARLSRRLANDWS